MVKYCISKDGKMVYINEEDFDREKFQRSGFIVGKNRMLFPGRDREAGEKGVEYPFGWAINPSALLETYPEEQQVFRDTKKISERICKYDKRGRVLKTN